MNKAWLSPEDEEVLSMPTYYGEEIYTHYMTHIISLINTKDHAIVVGSDGRAISESGKITDNERKIYELSPHCVMMYAGNIPGDIDTRMDDFSLLLPKAKIADVTPIADIFIQSFNNSEKSSAIPIKPLMAIVVGYDITSSGEAVPLLYLLMKSKETNEWYKHVSDAPYLHGGIAYYEVKDFIEQEFDVEQSLDDMNRFALRANRLASEAKPESVGGQPSLWNIRPGVPIKKFTPEEISSMLRS